MSAPAYRTYNTNGHDEFCLSFGAGSRRQILIIPPLFDEMNRMRRVLVSAMRDLAERRVGSALIDLPGCNESLAALAAQDLQSWRKAVSDCAAQLGATHFASFRGGTLIDGTTALPVWRLAPAKGSSLLKTMIRTRIAGEKEAGNAITEAQLMAQAERETIELGGNVLGPSMVEQLVITEPAPLSLLTERKLGEDIAGAPLWLRTEPQDDPAFAAAIADDLDRWTAACGG